jgi:hypothetical protein
MTDLGRGFLVTVLTVLLVLGSVSAWDKADRPAQFEVVADAVSGPDTLGLSVASNDQNLWITGKEYLPG